MLTIGNVRVDVVMYLSMRSDCDVVPIYASSRGQIVSSMSSLCVAERAFDATFVSRVASTTSTNTLAGQLPRRERWILLLLDGKRCIADLAHLTQRNKLDIAYTLARFLQSGYIEPLK